MQFKVVGLLVILLVHLSDARGYSNPITFNAQDDISEACRDVISDGSETSWALFTYEGKYIILGGTGNEAAYGQQFQSHLDVNTRAYGFVRIEAGDKLKPQAKFVFVTWIGGRVSPLKKAKVSTDKVYLRTLIENIHDIDKDIFTMDREDTNLDNLILSFEQA